jgi:hypothetical protein
MSVFLTTTVMANFVNFLLGISLLCVRHALWGKGGGLTDSVAALRGFIVATTNPPFV